MSKPTLPIWCTHLQLISTFFHASFEHSVVLPILSAWGTATFFFSRYNWVARFKKRMKCWAKGRAPWGGMVPAAFFLFFGWGPIRNCWSNVCWGFLGCFRVTPIFLPLSVGCLRLALPCLPVWSKGSWFFRVPPPGPRIPGRLLIVLFFFCGPHGGILSPTEYVKS